MTIDVERTQSVLAAGGTSMVMPGRPGGPMPLVFEAGLPDPESFPVDDLARLTEEVLRRDRAELQYGTPIGGDLSYGHYGLREQIAIRTSARTSVEVAPEGVMLTNGGGHGISLAVQAFVDAGDHAVVESPTWEYPLRDLEVAGAVVTAIPIDDEGLDPERLESHVAALARTGARLKVVYTIATFNVPTGTCLALDRRRRLVELAAEHGFLVIEDDVYGELRYSGEALPTLLELDGGAGHVLQVGSFSKTVMPGLRLGWVAGDPGVLAALDRVRRDLGVGQLIARVMAGYLGEGLLAPHVADVCARYRAKRDAVLAGLDEHCSETMTWNRPDGGYFVWLELADHVDGRALQRAAMEGGVFCRPGERFFGDPSEGTQRMRFAFTAAPVDQLVRACEVLGAAAR